MSLSFGGPLLLESDNSGCPPKDSANQFGPDVEFLRSFGQALSFGGQVGQLLLMRFGVRSDYWAGWHSIPFVFAVPRYINSAT